MKGLNSYLIFHLPIILYAYLSGLVVHVAVCEHQINVVNAFFAAPEIKHILDNVVIMERTPVEGGGSIHLNLCISHFSARTYQ